MKKNATRENIHKVMIKFCLPYKNKEEMEKGQKAKGRK